MKYCLDRRSWPVRVSEDAHLDNELSSRPKSSQSSRPATQLCSDPDEAGLRMRLIGFNPSFTHAS